MANWNDVYTRMQGGTPGGANVWTPKGNGIPKPDRAAAIAQMYNDAGWAHGGWDMHPGGQALDPNSRYGQMVNAGLHATAPVDTGGGAPANRVSLSSLGTPGNKALTYTRPRAEDPTLYKPGTAAAAPPVTTTTSPVTTTAGRPTGGTPLADDGMGAGSYTPLPMSAPSAGYTGGGGARIARVSSPTTTPGPTGTGSANPGVVGGTVPGRNATVPLSGLGSPGYGVNLDLYKDPSYQFRLQQGLDAMEQSAAARGSLASGETMRALSDYAGQSASQEYGNIFNRGANVRDFNYGVDRNDRDFDYRANVDDRNFDYTRESDMARLGLSAAGQANTTATAIAGMIASLMGNRGSIEAGGDIGGNNAITGSITQLINYLMQNGMLNALGAK